MSPQVTRVRMRKADPFNLHRPYVPPRSHWAHPTPLQSNFDGVSPFPDSSTSTSHAYSSTAAASSGVLPLSPIQALSLIHI